MGFVVVRTQVRTQDAVTEKTAIESADPDAALVCFRALAANFVSSNARAHVRAERLASDMLQWLGDVTSRRSPCLRTREAYDGATIDR